MQLNITLSDEDVERIAQRIVQLLPSARSSSADAQRLFSETEAAKLLGIGVSTLKRMRLAGEVRASVPRKPVRYSRADVDAATEFLSRRDA